MIDWQPCLRSWMVQTVQEDLERNVRMIYRSGVIYSIYTARGLWSAIVSITVDINRSPVNTNRQ